MRILFLSAFYPPRVIGGWEQLVQDINLKLQERGHVTHVLTSNYGLDSNYHNDDERVSRILTLESNLIHYQPMKFFRGRNTRQRENLRILEEQVQGFKPDVIFVHVMWNLWRGIPWYAEQLMPGKVVYYVADDWPYATNLHKSYWRSAPRHRILGLPKKLFAALPLKILELEERKYALNFQHVLCVSETVKINLIQHLGLPQERLQVIYNGIELDQFTSRGRSKNLNGKSTNLSLLYAGSLVPAKGVHTAIEALALLAQNPRTSSIKLTIVGSGHPDYIAQLRKLVHRYNLEGQVFFSNRVSRQEMPQLLRLHHVLVFPSIGEALPRVVQEAMAVGLVVVGTTAGGTAEILIEGNTGLTFPPGDASRLARQIERLSADQELYSRLAENGRDLIVRKFNIELTIQGIENSLLQVIQSESHQASASQAVLRSALT